MNFNSKCNNIIKKNNSFVCVGLDPVLEKLPKHLLKKPDPFFEFNKAIIRNTYDLVCSYKPNIAFYEAEGIKGLKSLQKTVKFLRKNYPEVLIILDTKRGDIDNTNNAYAKFFFNQLKVDGITLHPYLGYQALKPFLNLKDKFFFILCRTSNSGAGEFQDLKVKNQKLYEYVAQRISKYWNINQNCGLVTGATYPEELRKIRQITKNMWLLIPGIGKQGGDLEKTVKAAKNNFIINSSRGIIFVDDGKDFAQKAREKTKELKNYINQFRR